ncbi:MAG: DUF4157 domain-containing protein [bacterium]
MKKQESANKLEGEKKGQSLQVSLTQKKMFKQKSEDYFQFVKMKNLSDFTSIMNLPELSQNINNSLASNIFDYLHQNYGNTFIQKIIQAKLKICKERDIYEQEADRIADEIMRMPDQALQSQVDPEEEEEKLIQPKQITGLVQRQIKGTEEDEMISTKGKKEQNNMAGPELETNIHRLKGRGRPISRSDRIFFEKLFGFDLRPVRIHNDERASKLAESINAKAFTVGNNIVFNKGEFSLKTKEGKRLFSHELTHVRQQKEDKFSKCALQGLDPQQSGRNIWPEPKLYKTFQEWIEALPKAWLREKPEIKVTSQMPNSFRMLIRELKYSFDCADVAIILRHYYYKEHGIQKFFTAYRTPRRVHKKVIPGLLAIVRIGEGVSIKELRKNLVRVRARSFFKIPSESPVEFYGGSSNPEKNLAKLIKMGLKPGDVMIWSEVKGKQKKEKLEKPLDPEEKKEILLSGTYGHVQTIHNINAKSSPKWLSVFQGHMKRGGKVYSEIFKFEELTGDPDGNGEIKRNPRPRSNLFFVGAGKFKLWPPE